MKCPKCGSPMGEGQMYCGHCGTEIQIVPEFDTELDQNMRDALSETATQIAVSYTHLQRQQRNGVRRKRRRAHRHRDGASGSLQMCIRDRDNM